MKYEDFCEMIGVKPNIEEHLYAYDTDYLMVECGPVGFFFSAETHKFRFYSTCY